MAVTTTGSGYPGGAQPPSKVDQYTGYVKQAGNLWTSITGLFGGHPKDGERFNTNANAYRNAVSGGVGSQNSLEFLKYRSGRFGVAQSIGLYGGPIGGWATQAAQQDAWKLYESALSAWGLAPEEGGGGGTIPIAGGSDGTFTGGTGQGLPGVKVQASMSYGPLIAVGLVLAVIVGKKRGGGF